MSKLFVDDIVEKTSNHGVQIPGHVSQMIRAAAAPRVAGSVTAYTLIDTGVTASITPSSSSSRILILSQINMNAATATYHFSLIKRSIGGGTEAAVTGANQYGNTFIYKAGSEWLTMSTMVIDEPATTSAVAYKIYWTTHDNTTYNIGYNASGGNDNGNSLILLEIGG